MKHAASLLPLALVLAGCAAPPPAPAHADPHAAETSPSPAAAAAPPSRGAKPADRRLAQAVIAPLADLNLVRDEIPVVLAAALQAPYGPTGDGNCETLAADVEALEAALGADLDAPQDGQTLFERGADAAADAVIGAVHNATTGAIPFRGWLRKITGAEKHARQVAAAIQAGMIRRAYLKGLGHASGCLAPAAPRRDAP